MYEGDDMNLDSIETPPEESGNNKAFWIGIGILGFLIFAALVCGGVYLLVLKPRLDSNKAAIEATTVAQSAEVSQALTATAVSLSFTQAPPPLPEVSPTASPTLVVANVSATPGTPQAALTQPTALPATATVAAGFTQAAGVQLTIVPTTTALPGTGFADEVGAPVLLVMALVLVAVILLARRLRTTPLAPR